MWFAIWTVLILGALAFFAFLGWRLWRDSIKPLLVELTRAAEVTGELADKVAQLQAQQQEQAFTPDIGATPVQREALAQRRHDIRQARADRKAQRRERTYARWRALGQPF